MLVTSANKTRHPRSFSQTLRVNITSSQAEYALPKDFHQHSLQRFESLELSPSDHFILVAAVMYSQRHHWVYVHGQYPIIIDDERSRVATPDDLPIVARCARILLYERLSPADSSATALQRKPSNGSKSRPCSLA